MPLTLAVLGTGILGTAFTHRLLGAGHAVRVWNRTPERAVRLAAAGASVAATPREAVAGADAFITILADGPAVESAVTGAEGALTGRGDGRSAVGGGSALWIQASTVGVDWCARLGAAAAAAGVSYVDAPVLGTKQPAERGQLVIVASGDPELEDLARPVLSPLARRIVWLGAAGAGSRMKLVVNAWLIALVAALAESLALAEGFGLEGADFLDVIEGSPVGAPFARLKGDRMLAGGHDPAFPLYLALKDERLVIEAAEAAGVEPHVARCVVELYQRAADEGAAELDLGAVRRVWR